MSGIADFLASKLKELTPEKWDNFIRFLDSRFSPLEEKADIEERVSESILARGLQVIEDGIGPSIVKAQESADNIAAMADLGAVFFATSTTSLAINTNQKVLTIPANRRAQFAPAAYVLVTAGTTFTNGFVGRRVSYDRATGTLTLAVEQTMGEGTFANWSIGPIATTADLEALRDQVTTDRTAAQTARAGAEDARGVAEGHASAANTAKVGASQALSDLRAAVAPPLVEPGASSVGRLWYDGSSVRVYDGTGWVTAVTASLGGLRFEEGTFGAAPDGVITVGGGFSTALVFVDGVKLSSDQYTLDSPTITIASPVEGQDWFVWAYQALNATDYYTKQEVNERVNPKAPLASPALTGTPTAPTPAASDDTDRIATTSFVQSLIELLSMVVDGKAPKASPALTGTPTAPTPTSGDSTTRIATTAFVQELIRAVNTAISNLTATVATKLNLSGGTMTGQLTSIAGIPFESQHASGPRFSFHIPGVFRKYLQMGVNGALYWLDQGGTGHHQWAANGEYWSSAYGWIHDRFATASALANEASARAAGDNAALVWGGVGSYGFFNRTGVSVGNGAAVSGGSLTPAVGGTWRAMGFMNVRNSTNTGFETAGLFVRIS